ncbi:MULTISPECIES: hypothetical protein [unclassified Agarivorans]|uniref:hypothetical protein n=1 Tax=unclassified Agarivorans TaxID=2636026 RepID=UPI003D7D24D7
MQLQLLFEEEGISFEVDQSGTITYSYEDQDIATELVLKVFNEREKANTPSFIFAEKSVLEDFISYYEAAGVDLDSLIYVEERSLTWKEGKASEVKGLINNYFNAEILK